ncbi:MAG: cupredoxin domain-containing protein [Dehalococcoidia bacterium]|nr:cupredoxin domain-containing protein [Dehalococcoidia bacterium]
MGHSTIVGLKRTACYLLGIAAAAVLVGWSGVAGASVEADTAEIVIEARQFSYSPGVIRVKDGQRVKITLQSMDVTHGLYLDAYGLEVKATPGFPKTLEFVADKPGAFRFRCTQTCGSLHPFMAGKLVVSPNWPFNTSLALTGLVALSLLGYLWFRRGAPPPPVSGGAATPKTLEARPTGTWDDARPPGMDLLQLPLVGRLLRWRGFQFALMLPLLFLLALVLVAGWWGSPVGSHNLSIVSVWIVWWALLMILLVPLGGRLWCAVCPVPGPGEWLQRLSFVRKREGKPFTLGKKWPPVLRNMWLQSGAFLGFAIFSAVVLTTPAATASALAAFVALAFLMSLIFRGRTFCRYVCPLGGFIGLFALLAPLAVRVKDREACREHREKECIKGSAKGYGCPWFEYPGAMDRNAYCGLCMECVKTCSKGNIAVGLQRPGQGLLAGKARLDEAYKAFVVLASAALYSAVLLGPWGWLKSLAGNPLSSGFALYAAIVIGATVVVVPAVFLAVAWLSRLTAGGSRASTLQLWKTLSYGLVPLSLMAWLSFSLSLVLASGWYVIPVISDPLGRGWDIFGTAAFEGTPFVMGLLPYIQTAAMLGGLGWSMHTSWRICLQVFTNQKEAFRALLPITTFLSSATATFLWLYLG